MEDVRFYTVVVRIILVQDIRFYTVEIRIILRIMKISMMTHIYMCVVSLISRDHSVVV